MEENYIYMSRTLILFDVDGTLTESRLTIEPFMEKTLSELKSITDLDIGIVGGSDLAKQEEQLGKENIAMFNWVFSENGLMAFKDGVLFHSANIVKKLGESNYTHLVNICLRYLSLCSYPIRRGTFVEYRNGMINICPVGRSCSQSEREAFYKIDTEQKYREQLIMNIKKDWEEVCDIPLTFSIGGQISVDIFPRGWDKTYCLQFVHNKYDKIYFFGDKTYPGGNDYEIFNSEQTIGFSVTSPRDTEEKLRKLFLN